MTATSHWVEINQKLYALVDSANGEVLAKATFKEFWQYKYTEYLTLEQAQAAAEKAVAAEKIKREEENFPWNA